MQNVRRDILKGIRTGATSNFSELVLVLLTCKLWPTIKLVAALVKKDEEMEIILLLVRCRFHVYKALSKSSAM